MANGNDGIMIYVYPMDATKALYEMTERELQAKIRQLCDTLALTVQHIERSERTWLPGWPDLFILGTGALAVELKSMTGSIEPDQRKVRRAMLAAGIPYHLWTPAELWSGTVVRELTGISPREDIGYMTSDIDRLLQSL